MHDSAIVAAPVPVSIDGAQYLLSPLRDLDYEELDNWVRMRIVSLARASLTPAMPQAQRDETMRQALETAAGATFVGPLGNRLLSTLDGQAAFLLLSLRQKHPALTVETVRGWLRNPENRTALFDAFDLANNGGDGQGQKKTTAAETPEGKG